MKRILYFVPTRLCQLWCYYFSSTNILPRWGSPVRDKTLVVSMMHYLDTSRRDAILFHLTAVFNNLCVFVPCSLNWDKPLSFCELQYCLMKSNNIVFLHRINFII